MDRIIKNINYLSKDSKLLQEHSQTPHVPRLLRAVDHDGHRDDAAENRRRGRAQRQHDAGELDPEVLRLGALDQPGKFRGVAQLLAHALSFLLQLGYLCILFVHFLGSGLSLLAGCL